MATFFEDDSEGISLPIGREKSIGTYVIYCYVLSGVIFGLIYGLTLDDEVTYNLIVGILGGFIVIPLSLGMLLLAIIISFFRISPSPDFFKPFLPLYPIYIFSVLCSIFIIFITIIINSIPINETENRTQDSLELPSRIRKAPTRTSLSSKSRRTRRSKKSHTTLRAKSSSSASIARTKTKEKICPDCGNNLTIRSGRFGEFWGCKSYPSCRYTENISKEDSRSRTRPLKKVKPKSLKFRIRGTCAICGKGISNTERKEECPGCHKEFHYEHFAETVRQTGYCPVCKVEIIIENIEKPIPIIESCPICFKEISDNEKRGQCPECYREFHYKHFIESVKQNGCCPICSTTITTLPEHYYTSWGEKSGKSI
ncbi:MAG: topoisomerase DNA-binding C4 zinc finger domain-containing protein [Candidatus Hodarchaeota archaeon]